MLINTMNHFVWKLGEGCDRTKRVQTEKKALTEPANELALQSSTNSSIPKVSNRPMSLIRENSNIKISEREPVIQSNLNPFMNSDNYISDLETQDKFLRPQDSNYNK